MATSPRGISWKKWLLYGAIFLCLGACLAVLPCSFEILDGEGWARSAHSIQIIGEAVRLYEKKHGRLPPAAVTDKDGKPLYSWRVLILPYLGEETLYQQFKLDQPWDSPDNRKLLDQVPGYYAPGRIPTDPPGLTRYQVFVGPGTAFERDGLTFQDFPDGVESTLLVVEAAEPVPWSKPADLVYDPDHPLPSLRCPFGKPVVLLCYDLYHKTGFNAVFADGSKRFIGSRADEKALRGLITRNGGEVVDKSRLD
jgi:hypothetical protein